MLSILSQLGVHTSLVTCMSHISSYGLLMVSSLPKEMDIAWIAV